jgi:hypothetical protein
MLFIRVSKSSESYRGCSGSCRCYLVRLTDRRQFPRGRTCWLYHSSRGRCPARPFLLTIPTLTFNFPYESFIHLWVTTKAFCIVWSTSGHLKNPGAPSLLGVRNSQVRIRQCHFRLRLLFVASSYSMPFTISSPFPIFLLSLLILFLSWPLHRSRCLYTQLTIHLIIH